MKGSFAFKINVPGNDSEFGREYSRDYGSSTPTMNGEERLSTPSIEMFHYLESRKGSIRRKNRGSAVEKGVTIPLT